MTKFTKSQMTNQQHPITPPLLLVKQWVRASPLLHSDNSWAYELFITQQAARWGADQELEACVEWLQDPDLNVDTYKLKAARRPKPPSLQKQAYDALDTYIYGEPDPRDKERTYNIIRKALETLDD